MTKLTAILALLAVAAGCARDDSISAAEACLRRFQAALAQGDRRATRDCVTSASKPYVARLPRPAAATKPLRVTGRRREHARVFLQVRDENPGAPARQGTYVVVREHGEWRVDLIATAGANSREQALPGPPTRLVPAQLTPEQVRRAERRLRSRPPARRTSG